MRPHYMASLPILLLISNPAIARDSWDYNDIEYVAGTGTTTQDVEQLATRMADPVLQNDIAIRIEAMTDELMQLPIGKFAQLIENTRPGTLSDDFDSNSTLADIAGPAAHELPARLGDQTRLAINMMGKFASVLAVMLPEFEQLGVDLESQMERTLQQR